MEHEIIAMWVQTVAEVVALGWIVWLLFQMQAAGQRRDREIDEMAAAFRKQAEAAARRGEALARMLERQAAVFAPLLRRPSEADR